MRIDRLELQNFRGFEKLDLALDPSLTVLIGENGAGKTAVLDGLATAVSSAANAPALIGERDARRRVYEHEGALSVERQWPVHVRASGTIDGVPARWECSRESEEPAPSSARQYGGTDLRAAVKAGQPRALPVIAYYRASRAFWGDEVTQAKRGVGSRLDGYASALDAEANHGKLAEWMFQQTLVELQRRQDVPQLRAIERAVCSFIDGATRFFFDVQSQGLILERKAAQPLPLSLLSDGYRTMVALVADVAWRAVVLNPQYGAEAATRSEGIVLIDEVDLHLHPRWQRQVLGDLQRTFPKLQFVVTTHSPQILASARREQVRVLQDSVLRDVRPFVEGRDSNSLLEDIFGVPERPEPVRRTIEEMSALLDEERYEEGAKLLESLEARLGPDDPAIIRARWILAHEATPRDHA